MSAMLDMRVLRTRIDPEPCHAGYYQDQVGQSACKVCKPGYFCPGMLSASGPDGTVLCPSGSYCPSGTSVAHPCSPGTYGPSPGLAACQGCPSGKACVQPGTIQPTVCPAGYYCESNCSSPTPCPIGTYSSSLGLEAESECRLCPAGRYCASVGITQSTGECIAGIFCEAGANDSSTLVDAESPSGRRRVIPCPAGHYCIAGSEAPSPCPPGTYCAGGDSLPAPCEPGTYNQEAMQTSCKPCPPGYICSPGAVVDYARGRAYAVEGLEACADPDVGMPSWTQELVGGAASLIGGVAHGRDDSLYVSVSVWNNSGGQGGQGGYEVYVTKHRVDGTEVWRREVAGGEGSTMAEGIGVDEAGSVYVGMRR
ncbi:hypothetical protein GUITHDRAFT_107322 [Guillardia theta CCMP2712]|uniref:Tyrosine-protein kinase ephrin type A/B receptor-like domain-containing protein n=1 Tax=Guillardia theta (strain CCMP2712) TaxID=905079 RepID=L1JEL5_GUITC|nr:hypothetical protein GUITHDRAFT_107322 [Guillardia theta CCMP2712]EKX46973.1 hypothetical protein GUITHDRAFT_107322 [Guillardia theta CCMP2712]|eukprot:XP_005833953.1 hypothetical protein GUITHDRAFT_107322 [Guillardia theta CCMP2712]